MALKHLNFIQHKVNILYFRCTQVDGNTFWSAFAFVYEWYEPVTVRQSRRMETNLEKTVSCKIESIFRFSKCNSAIPLISPLSSPISPSPHLIILTPLASHIALCVARCRHMPFTQNTTTALEGTRSNSWSPDMKAVNETETGGRGLQRFRAQIKRCVMISFLYTV